MAEAETSKPGDPAAALAVEVARLWKRLENLEGGVAALGTSVVGTQGLAEQVRALGAKVAELGAVVAALAEGEEQDSRAPRPVWWPNITDPGERQRAWEVLGDWVTEVLRARHPQLFRRLGRCWYRHPDVVDELSALRVAWSGAYEDTRATATATIEWHDRWLPGCIDRCAKAVAGCKGQHEADTEPPPTDAAAFSAFIAQDARRP